tara:strand:- start:9500 stop:10585 length:1086 start_codon:yes stop_codon:yes gene_type:complete
MKYTHKAKLKDGSTVYRFNPPKDAKSAGVVEHQTFSDGRVARHEIPKLVKIVDDFRKGNILVGKIGVTSNLRQVLTYYYNTGQYNSLSTRTKKTYMYGFNRICKTKIFNRELGDITVKSLTSQHCTQLYDTWASRVGVDHANQLSRILSVLLNFCRSIELIESNPMSRVKKRSHEPRSVTWDKKEVELFIDTAFTQFKWRNIGLLALLAYEWGQRPIDITLLEWTDIDFSKQMVTIKQTKRGETVKLPVENKILKLVLQQGIDWDWQPYILPHLRPADGNYIPIPSGMVSQLANEVKSACGLNMNLHMGDLRKTAIVELIESGVDSLAIMHVTGHKNVQSLNPYNKRNFDTAKSALDMRRG